MSEEFKVWHMRDVLERPQRYDPDVKEKVHSDILRLLNRWSKLESILVNKEPDCEPCEEIAVGRAQAYHEVQEFMRTEKWRNINEPKPEGGGDE